MSKDDFLDDFVKGKTQREFELRRAIRERGENPDEVLGQKPDTAEGEKTDRTNVVDFFGKDKTKSWEPN